jgi:hypothetical protein
VPATWLLGRALYRADALRTGDTHPTADSGAAIYLGRNRADVLCTRSRSSGQNGTVRMGLNQRIVFWRLNTNLHLTTLYDFLTLINIVYVFTVIVITNNPTVSHTLMYLQITFWTECIFTQITDIWKLRSMYTLMYLQITFWTECFFYTNHSYMEPSQYGHVDVPSDYFCQ